MQGIDIKLLSKKTGISENKLYQLLTRHPELKEKPYSVKSGKHRIFFEQFIDWLKDYEGISDVPTKAVKDVRNTLPNGKQIKHRCKQKAGGRANDES
jgi:hypothetical protein